MKGVSRTKSGKWQSKININGKPVYLGTFRTAKEASDAYQAMRTKHPVCPPLSPQGIADAMDEEIRRRSMLPLQERERTPPSIGPDLLETIISLLPKRFPQIRERKYE